jgi:hypothetical protein
MAAISWNGVGFYAVTIADAYHITAAGNYGFCHMTQYRPPIHGVLYTGEAADIGERAHRHANEGGRMDDALAAGATHMIISHDFPSYAARCDLETLLRYELRPPLNQELPPMLETAYAAAQRLKLHPLIFKYADELAQIRATAELRRQRYSLADALLDHRPGALRSSY